MYIFLKVGIKERLSILIQRGNSHIFKIIIFNFFLIFNFRFSFLFPEKITIDVHDLVINSPGLHMESDVAGATFMAAASSSPEMFINCVGTFVTEGDLGVGAVVGSAVFNVLAVPACCALVACRVNWTY